MSRIFSILLLVFMGGAVAFGAPEWEVALNTGLAEVRLTGQLLVRIVKEKGYGYSQVRAFNSPEIQELMERDVLLSGDPSLLSPPEGEAQSRLRFVFFSFRGDYLGSCMPANKMEFQRWLKKALEINELLVQSVKAPMAEKKKLLEKCFKLLEGSASENLAMSSTNDRLGHEIGALCESNADYYYRYHHGIWNFNLEISELYACGEDSAAIIRKVDELYSNPSIVQGVRRSLLYIKIFMMLDQAKSEKDIAKIRELYQQFLMLFNSNNKELVSIPCKALDSPATLLRDKKIRQARTKKMLVKDSPNFAERCRKRCKSSVSSETKKPKFVEVKFKNWEVESGFFGNKIQADGQRSKNVAFVFEEMGINFSEVANSFANFMPGIKRLEVRQTQENIDKIDTLIADWKKSGGKGSLDVIGPKLKNWVVGVEFFGNRVKDEGDAECDVSHLFRKLGMKFSKNCRAVYSFSDETLEVLSSKKNIDRIDKMIINWKKQQKKKK